MTIEIAKEEIDKRKERLVAEYGEVPVLNETKSLSGDEFQDHLKEYVENNFFGGAGAWVEKNGDVLLISEDTDHSGWGVPYGGHENAEILEETAVREVREETGIICEIKDLFQLWHIIWVSEGDHEERIHHMGAFFDAEYSHGKITTEEDQSEEVEAAKWFSEPPKTVHHAIERRTEEWRSTV